MRLWGEAAAGHFLPKGRTLPTSCSLSAITKQFQSHAYEEENRGITSMVELVASDSWQIKVHGYEVRLVYCSTWDDKNNKRCCRK